MVLLDEVTLWFCKVIDFLTNDTTYRSTSKLNYIFYGCGKNASE